MLVAFNDSCLGRCKYCLLGDKLNQQCDYTDEEVYTILDGFKDTNNINSFNFFMGNFPNPDNLEKWIRIRNSIIGEDTPLYIDWPTEGYDNIKKIEFIKYILEKYKNVIFYISFSIDGTDTFIDITDRSFNCNNYMYPRDTIDLFLNSLEPFKDRIVYNIIKTITPYETCGKLIDNLKHVYNIYDELNNKECNLQNLDISFMKPMYLWNGFSMYDIVDQLISLGIHNVKRGDKFRKRMYGDIKTHSVHKFFNKASVFGYALKDKKYFLNLEFKNIKYNFMNIDYYSKSGCLGCEYIEFCCPDIPNMITEPSIYYSCYLVDTIIKFLKKEPPKNKDTMLYKIYNKIEPYYSTLKNLLTNIKTETDIWTDSIYYYKNDMKVLLENELLNQNDLYLTPIQIHQKYLFLNFCNKKYGIKQYELLGYHHRPLNYMDLKIPFK